ncbi:PREDICTED: mitochondrial import inner membrane translocase subunit Tim23 [Cyphomyrmex costatus]|uniref:mitochondrial import inner membrane translocase subunit Tim23 n=1 Tax=Cyphomyrmex costatus TaxID=456900 RepID=UPI000852336A|nr:PREDICTED: mitochondrial import inner membrane translocase subunit Tim23 [Cyphomyrmex costatus]XP_018403631.1 PREDICTED: mitochondrial import inner membrane translocase subunit Tim23 [Cyphomyrmex costatus]XP_018403632.1 PREDICTED: mitochondrial import inner membrane translocase subunit Tim23 [Cyphomyrmex costatus]
MIDFRTNSGKTDDDNGKYSNTNIPVTSQQGLASLSPYLNFDPSYLPVSQPEFIFPDGAMKQRGRFELAFSQIGTACIAGAGIGGASGLYRGIKATSIAGETGKLRRTQLINHVMKGGASMANSLGVIMIMYTCAGIGLTWVRGTDDSLNTIVAAATSAAVFRSPAGIRKAGIAGVIAAGIAVMYCTWNNGGISLHRVNRLKHAA